MNKKIIKQKTEESEIDANGVNIPGQPEISSYYGPEDETEELEKELEEKNDAN